MAVSLLPSPALRAAAPAAPMIKSRRSNPETDFAFSYGTMSFLLDYTS
jgi:hypothetical protein